MTSTAPSLEALLAAKEIVVCCGPGGVGKTTAAAAAAAMAATSLGAKVLVITVDPARRLADALGLDHLDNSEAPVDLHGFPGPSSPGAAAPGELWAAMLDTRRSWDDLVRRHAPDQATARRILDNPLYQDIAERFVQSHDYIAMERLYEIHSTGVYDLIVVDTPPSRHAIDLLEAPGRLGEFFSSRWLRWLTLPARSLLLSAASRPFTQVADRILGAQFVADIAEFFLLLSGMYEGFFQRSQAVQRLLRDHRTTFVVVTTLEPSAAREADFLLGALVERGLHVGALVLNKVLPTSLCDPAVAAVAARLRTDAPALAGALGEPGPDADLGGRLARVLVEVGESFANFSLVAKREAQTRTELAHSPEMVVDVAHFDRDIADLEGLGRVGRALWLQP